ncbi:DnaJ-domain-containing protein [Fomitopsis serialis]|uniref:DnaJ-domain-containing protein n=1 Tax=Fomitopsis serialis TaxID=139415 RepID=UPI0020078272|nr:DnaJ-domain-containing protein [Neoantrodia serialis]KAH9928309.1 DnaJ-domain-containing protein [Neoantrodia serialis]
MWSTFWPLLCLLLLAVVTEAADLYKALELSKSASEQDIRKAYKKLSRKYHPDRNQERGAEEKFIEVAHAYEVLSDPEKRQVYDRYGEDGLKANEGGRHAGNPFDIFQNFFGGGFSAQQQVRKGPTVHFDVELPVHKHILCDHCRGTGAASSGDIHTCPACNGAGVQVVRQQIMPGMWSQAQVTCNQCGGRGSIITRKCPHCDGAKVIEHTQVYSIEIHAGVPEGWQIVLESEGDESPDYEPGDIVLRIKSRKTQGSWRRKESALYWKETIGVDEALLGFERNLTHLDGHVVQIKRDVVTQPGFVEVVDGEGMPTPEHEHSHGNLYVEYTVVLPTEVSPEKKRREYR